MTVTSRLHRQKDTERQRKTEENVEIRPVVARRYESVGCIPNGKKQKASLASTKKKNASPRIMDEAESLAAICKPRPSSEGKRRSERMRLVQDKCLLTLS